MFEVKNGRHNSLDNVPGNYLLGNENDTYRGLVIRGNSENELYMMELNANDISENENDSYKVTIGHDSKKLWLKQYVLNKEGKYDRACGGDTNPYVKDFCEKVAANEITFCEAEVLEKAKTVTKSTKTRGTEFDDVSNDVDNNVHRMLGVPEVNGAPTTPEEFDMYYRS